MTKLTLTFMLTGFAVMLAATPILKPFVPTAAVGMAAAQDVDVNEPGPDETDGPNNDGQF
jgi:hypothetical protein